MRIALLSQWFTPEPEARVTQLAKQLTKRGHDVTVLTGFPNYPSGKLYDGYKLSLFMREDLNGTKVVRMLLYPEHSRSSIKRVLNYLSFAFSASLLGPFLSGPIDLLWVYHPPLTIGIPAIWIHLLRRTPFVYEIQDMWPETVMATGMMSNSFGIKLLRNLANVVYKSAAAITVSSPGFKRNLIGKGVDEKKIFVISNWADEEIIYPSERETQLGTDYHLTDSFNIMFSGNIGAAQGLDTVIEAAALLGDLPKVKFVFIGDGIAVGELKALVAKKQLSNVQFIDRQPMNVIRRFHAWADVLLIHLRNDPLFEITIPSKTLAYLASGRPIICAVTGDGADVVRNANAGLICPPDDPAALAQTVRDLYRMPAQEREAMGQKGYQHYLEMYSMSAMTDKFEALFNSVTSKSNEL